MTDSTAPPTRVRWGIIGCGNIAMHALCPAIRWSSNGTLHAVASRTAEDAENKAREAQAARFHASYAELLADSEVDAVYIGLPNGLHEEWAIRAAAAGKHVLCEKSLALRSAAARRMVEACRKAGVRLMEGFMYRHHPQWDVVRRLLDEGAVGDIRLVRAGLFGDLAETRDHRWSSTMGGGALYDVTCYGINIARWIYGREPLAIIAEADTRTAEKVDRTSCVCMDFGNGRLATAHGSLVSTNHQYASIEGSRGRIDIVNPVIPGWDQTEVVVTRGMGTERIAVPGANHFLHEVEHFAACVLDASRPLEPGEDGLKNVLACEAAEQSWVSGRRVEVEET